jgi:hypothetical protein
MSSGPGLTPRSGSSGARRLRRRVSVGNSGAAVPRLPGKAGSCISSHNVEVTDPDLARPRRRLSTGARNRLAEARQDASKVPRGRGRADLGFSSPFSPSDCPALRGPLYGGGPDAGDRRSRNALPTRRQVPHAAGSRRLSGRGLRGPSCHCRPGPRLLFMSAGPKSGRSWRALDWVGRVGREDAGYVPRSWCRRHRSGRGVDGNVVLDGIRSTFQSRTSRPQTWPLCPVGVRRRHENQSGGKNSARGGPASPWSSAETLARGLTCRTDGTCSSRERAATSSLQRPAPPRRRHAWPAVSRRPPGARRPAPRLAGEREEARGDAPGLVSPQAVAG